MLGTTIKSSQEGDRYSQEVNESYVHNLKEGSKILAKSFEVLLDRSKSMKFNSTNKWRINMSKLDYLGFLKLSKLFK